MLAPYQCLEVAGNILVAASGHELQTFSLETGAEISSWACPRPIVEGKKEQPHEKVVIEVSPESSEKPEDGSEDPPAKRRKISDDGEKKAAVEDEKSNENKKNGRPKAKQLRQPADRSLPPNFIALTASKDGKYVVAVTGEDKHVRVFENESGQLKQISSRPMAKRPCAIALTASDSLIIIADKFGDVYSLPLQEPEVTETETPKAPEPAAEEPKKFVSSANDKTVHSVRNRKALENQLKQNLVKTEKSESNPGQVLLLGHVSMLTDIALVERNGRNYIVTADRDEHIRVSRGIPQAHIIENYCMGHTDFVSKLCFPSSAPEILVSGGGDDDLFTWKWQTGELLGKTDLIGPLNEVIGTAAGGEKTKVVVSGIKHVAAGGDAGTIVVTCEGVPALFLFALTAAGKLTLKSVEKLEGNALAVAVIGDKLAVSVDTVHQKCSISEARSGESESVSPLVVFNVEGGKLVKADSQFNPAESHKLNGEVGRWAGALYGLVNLRKRAGEE